MSTLLKAARAPSVPCASRLLCALRALCALRDLCGKALGAAALVVICVAASGCAVRRVTPEPVYFPPPPSVAHVVHLKSFNRLTEVVGEPRDKKRLFGRRISSPAVARPAGVAYDAEQLYICDAEAGYVHVWDLANGRSRRVGHRGDVVLIKPVAVAVDDRGRVYVADTQRGEVVAYNADGSFLQRFKAWTRDAYRPVAVAVREGELYVADLEGLRIDVFSTVDGRMTDSIAAGDAPDIESMFPMGIAFDDGSRWYVSDAMGSRVLAFDGRKMVSSFGGRGNRYGRMGKPRGLAVGPDGVVFVADPEFAHVHLFDRRGRLLMLFGGAQDATGGTPAPVGVATAANLPETITSLVPEDFAADYFVFVTNSIGIKRVSLFAVGRSR